MGKKILCLLLMSILFLCGCRKDSKDNKESLERQGYQINKKMTAVIKSINDNDSAKKAIPQLKSLVAQLQDNGKKLAKLYNNNVDIATEYGIQIYQHKIREQVPALEKLYDKGVSPKLVEEIFNTMTSGGYNRAQKMLESQKTGEGSTD